MSSVQQPPLWRVLAAYGAIYFFWGASYIGIRFAVETIPPFVMGGVRLMVAGIVLYIWGFLRGAPHPKLMHWRGAVIASFFASLLNNSAIFWAQQYVPSGVVALLTGAVPMWMVLIDWLRPGGVRPNSRVIGGAMLGMVGIALLISPGKLALHGDHPELATIAVAALLIAPAFWALGTLYARGAALPESATMSTATQLFTGGVMMTLLGVVTGETAHFTLAQVSLRSLGAWVYLMIFSSIIAFSCFVWLMRVDNPARVSTYAYVNPIVAVFLGWALAGEAFTLETLIATVVIVAAIMMINSGRARSGSSSESPSPTVRIAEGAEA